MLGEAKSGVFNVLVTHMLDTWMDCLVDSTQTCHRHGDSYAAGSLSSSDEGGSPEHPAVALTEAVVASMRAHTDLLLKAALFGPVHKKNIRSVE